MKMDLALVRKAEELDRSLDVMKQIVSLFENSSSVIEEYRSTQNLQLTALQAKILDCIDEDKMEDANLRELVSAYNILKNNERLEVGKPTEIHGLIGYLTYMEQKANVTTIEEEESIDAEFEIVGKPVSDADANAPNPGEDNVPNL